jgi:NADH-quinone oxidoreductase subunit N
MFQFVSQYLGNLRLFYPEFIIFGCILLIIIVDLVFREKSRPLLILIALLGLGLSVYAVKYNIRGSYQLFFNAVVFDPIAIFFKALFLVAGFLSILIFISSTEISSKETGEFLVMILGSIAGMCVLVSANDVIVFYLAFETVSLPSYVLSGLSVDSGRSREAALKYIIFGAVASGIMLFGFSMLCGVTGATNFQSINSVLQSSAITPGSLFVIVSMIVAGLAFKISAVPFHMWAPDVYEGSAMPVTAYFSVVPKAAGFAALIRFFFSVFQSSGDLNSFVNSVEWYYLWGVVSIATMTLGNLAAIPQNNIKRLLAYSSIAHVGYMLIGFLVATIGGISSIMFYLIIYLFMNLGAFYVALLFREKLGTENINDYSGIGWRAPFLSSALSVFLLSLTGIPPLAGFVGKIIIFSAAINSKYYIIVLIALLNSVISLYYYAGIIKKLFLEVSDRKEVISVGLYSRIIVLIFLAPVLILGVYWNSLYHWIMSLLGVE